jgi:hypothetical protein
VTQRIFLGSVSAPKSLGFGGGNGGNKFTGGAQKSSTTANSGIGATNGPATPSYDGEGTYMIFNVGDSLCISDHNSHDKVTVCLQLVKTSILFGIVTFFLAYFISWRVFIQSIKHQFYFMPVFISV